MIRKEYPGVASLLNSTEAASEEQEPDNQQYIPDSAS
jgi:hypothetical protein